MNKYVLEYDGFEGSMCFDYDEHERLRKFETNMLMTDKQLQYFNRNFPVVEGLLNNIVGDKGRLTLVSNLTFDTFWDKFAHKANKKQAENAWKNLSKEKKVKAMVALPKYKYYQRISGKAHLLASSYLNGERYLDDYDELIKEAKAGRG